MQDSMGLFFFFFVFLWMMKKDAMLDVDNYALMPI